MLYCTPHRQYHNVQLSAVAAGDLHLHLTAPDAKLSRREHSVMTPSLPAHSPSLRHSELSTISRQMFSVMCADTPAIIVLKSYGFGLSIHMVLLDFGSFNVQLFSNVCIFLIISSFSPSTFFLSIQYFEHFMFHSFYVIIYCPT